MDVIQNFAIAGKEEETSSTKSLRLMIKLNDDPTKGKFVNVLTGISDYQLLDSFFKTHRTRLKTKGLQGQFLKMDVCKFQTLIKLKLNNHSDWDKWLARLLEVTQDYALVPPLWIYSYKCLFSEHKI